MSLQAARLIATVTVNGASAAKAALSGVSDSVTHTQGTLSKLGQAGATGIGNAVHNLERWGTAAAGAGVGIAAAAVKSAIDFQSQMELIATQAKASQGEVDTMKGAVLSLATTTATGPTTLAEGLYHIESAGLRGAKALDVLKASALGTRVGMADMEDVTNALVAIEFSGVKGAKNMTDAMGVLDATVGVGNMRMQDFVQALGSGVLGTAGAVGLSLQSLGAAMATLTDAGVPAERAATNLQHSLILMAAPTTKARKELKLLGLGQFDLANDLRKPDGIFAALSDLRTHFEKLKLSPNQQVAALAAMFGGGKQAGTIIQLYQQMDRVNQKFDLITQKAGEFGIAIDQTRQTAAFQFSQLQADAEVAGITLGNALLPGVVKFADGLTKMIAQNQGKIKAFAGQVGDAFSGFVDVLAKVDWGHVADMFRAVAGGVKTIIDAFLTMPDWVKELLIGGFALNKLTGGMVVDMTKIVAGGLSGTISNLLSGIGSKLPIVGGAIGSIAAVHVYVVNWPAGLGLGGGGVGTAAGAAAGGITAAGAAAIAAGAIIIPAALTATWEGVLLPGLRKQSADNITALTSELKTGSLADLQRSLSGLEQMPAKLNPLQQVLYNLDASGIKTHTESLEAAIRDEIKAREQPGAQGVGPIGEHSAEGPRLVAAVNSMSTLNSRNLIAFRSSEHADLSRTNDRLTSGTARQIEVAREAKANAQRAAAMQLTTLERISARKGDVNVNVTSDTTVNVDGRNVAHVIHRWQAPFPTYGPTGSAF